MHGERYQTNEKTKHGRKKIGLGRFPDFPLSPFLEGVTFAFYETGGSFPEST